MKVVEKIQKKYNKEVARRR